MTATDAAPRLAHDAPGPPLVLAAVRYQYAGSRSVVLDELDLEVAGGRVVAVVGPNDAGKSTLCLVAAGLAPGVIGGRLEGSVRLVGTPTTELAAAEAAQRCGILFQNPLTQLSGTAQTVWEEVAFGPRNVGLGLTVVVERVEEALDALAIGHLAARDPAHLSGGQAQLVALASVLALRPACLVLDEPTSQLDPEGTRLVGAAIRRLATERGRAVLLVEHKTALVGAVADEVAVMAAGRVVLRGAPADVLDDPALAELGVERPPAGRVLGVLASTVGGAELDRARAAVAEVVADEWDERVAGGSHAEARGTPATAKVASPADVGLPPGDSADGATGDEGIAARQPTSPDAARPVDIRFEGASFQYPDGTTALEAVDLRIGPGERVAIVGQNGSGKSTLVRHLNGLLRPTSGRVTFDGQDIRKRRVAELARSVGLAFQNPDRQIFAGSVRREVAFGPRNLGVRGEALEAAVRSALAAVGLDARGDDNPYDLGYSRRKLLAIASILAMDTGVLVLDEPTTGQDAEGIERVRRIVADRSAAGRTVVAISHDLRFVAESFARVVVMRAGRIVLDGTPGAVFAEGSWPVLRSTFLEPPLAARVGARLGVGSTPTEDALAEAVAAAGRTALHRSGG